MPPGLQGFYRGVDQPTHTTTEAAWSLLLFFPSAVISIQICGVTMELCNMQHSEVEEMITSSTPSFLGAKPEVLPKGHFGFLSL